jgi:hypothetical protein
VSGEDAEARHGDEEPADDGPAGGQLDRLGNGPAAVLVGLVADRSHSLVAAERAAEGGWPDGGGHEDRR